MSAVWRVLRIESILLGIVLGIESIPKSWYRPGTSCHRIFTNSSLVLIAKLKFSQSISFQLGDKFCADKLKTTGGLIRRLKCSNFPKNKRPSWAIVLAWSLWRSNNCPLWTFFSNLNRWRLSYDSLFTLGDAFDQNGVLHLIITFGRRRHPHS